MMRTSLKWLLLPIVLAAAPAGAATVTDAVGDFVPGFIGPNNGDLDVTSFSVDYSGATSSFLLGATFAGEIDPATVGFYVIGANTGTGPNAPFASLGQPNVRFNQAIVIQKNGTGNVGANQLAPGSIVVTGNMFTAVVPLSFLPSTGFAPENYGFNLWPRVGSGNNNQISDFSPENATLAAATAVPEPASWAMMIGGFGLVGGALRRHGRVGSSCPV